MKLKDVLIAVNDASKGNFFVDINTPTESICSYPVVTQNLEEYFTFRDEEHQSISIQLPLNSSNFYGFLSHSCFSASTQTAY